MEKKSIKQVYQFLEESVNHNVDKADKEDVLTSSKGLINAYDDFMKCFQTWVDFEISSYTEWIEDWCKCELGLTKDKCYTSESDIPHYNLMLYKFKNHLFDDFAFMTEDGDIIPWSDRNALKKHIFGVMFDDESERLQLMEKEENKSVHPSGYSSWDIFFRHSKEPAFPNSVNGWDWCCGGDF